MIYKTIIGIDPGRSGALVALNINNQTIISFHDIQILGDKIDMLKISQWLDIYKRNDTLIICENPMIHKTDGIKTTYAAFMYGYSVGAIQAIIISLGFDHDFVTPMQWKNYFNLCNSSITYQEKKHNSVVLAINLNNIQSNIFIEQRQRGKNIQTIEHHDRAEAYLMALYGINNSLEQ